MLPVDRLSWEDFERLSLRLLELDTELVHLEAVEQVEETADQVVRQYGVLGQAQMGIDVYARVRFGLGELFPERPYLALQARRIKKVSKAELRGSVTDFLEGKWSSVSRKFVYATSGSTRSVDLSEAIEELASELAKESIEFVVWDREAISMRLKESPELVDDFFGRAWVKRFCGETAAEGLRTRLDAKQVHRLRQGLSGIYKASFGIADSGQIAFRFSGTATIGLRDRFVTPNLSITTPQAASLSHALDDFAEPDADDHTHALLSDVAASQVLLAEDDAWFLRNQGPRQSGSEKPQVSERLSADQWIGKQSRQVIVGEPGAGKSTLLRYLILDLLSEEPKWHRVASIWGNYLPVWLPFHFFTQRVEGQTGSPASIGETLKAWLDQYDSGKVWPLVEKALNDKRLLLVVDGLDEWVSEEAGRYGVASLRSFADTRAIPLIVSSRPYGLTRLTLGASWTHARIAPLTPEQQRQLASRYFQATVDHEEGPPSGEVIQQSVDTFLSQVRDSPDLRAISGIPLFLVLLVGLHLSSDAKLPAGRFEVYDRAVRLLVSDHPAQRRTAAAVTARRQGLTDEQLRTVLAKIAFESQNRGDFATLSESVLREDFVNALRDPEGLAMDAAQAATTADQLGAVAEGHLGILVRRGPTELGFLHRMLQEQLAAEHISKRLSITRVKELFASRVGHPQWREVLLATTWRITRPGELRELVGLIEQQIDDTPAGLRARELLAELIFGPYELPSVEIRKHAIGIVEAIETHPYGPHRARLLDSVLVGLDGSATEDVVLECLKRWTLLVREPSAELVRAIAQTPPVAGLSKTVCKLLLRGLRYPDKSVAYESGLAIASRCSEGGTGNEIERCLLREGLIEVLSDPPSAYAAAAALIALVLEWREDPLIVELLGKAREHSAESVRVVALSEALGVLRPQFSGADTTPPRDIPPLSDEEGQWLLSRLEGFGYSDSYGGLLVAALSEVAKGQHSVLEDLLDCLQDPRRHQSKYRDIDLVWSVTLNAFGDDRRVLDLVCEQLRSEKSSGLSLRVMMYPRLLAAIYPVDSRHNDRIAAAIEYRVGRSMTDMVNQQRYLYGLAAVDRGPVMKKALLDSLVNSSLPHWSAHALVEFFSDDVDAQNAVRSVLMGTPLRASMIATVATKVLRHGEAIPRLLTILGELKEDPSVGSPRYDLVASALVQSRREQEIGPGPELEEIAAEALRLVPNAQHLWSRDPLHYMDARHEIAGGFYPSEASRTVLAEFGDGPDLPLVPLLRVYRDDTEAIRSLLDEAATIMCSLPAFLRSQVCQSLADRPLATDLILELAHRWADEVYEPNKSIASLAYHRSLLEAKQEERIEASQWNSALTHLGEQASCYGPDHGARRRAAWVGICLLKEWSVLQGRVETIGETEPVGVPIASPFYGPDGILLQQIASRWEDLRAEFGAKLMRRLSGLRAEKPENKVWDSLAFVAHQNPALHQELEQAVSDDPELLKLKGVLVWFITRTSGSADTVVDALVSYLRTESGPGENLIVALLTAHEPIDIPRAGLQVGLETALNRERPHFGNSMLEVLAVLDPKSPVVHDCWQRISTQPLRLGSHLAVGYAAVDACQVSDRIELDLKRLGTVAGSSFDSTFTRHVSHRLRRDEFASAAVRNTALNPRTPDAQAALLMSILAYAVGIDEDLQTEASRRLTAQKNVVLAPIVRDRTVAATLSLRTILTRVEDAAWGSRSA